MECGVAAAHSVAPAVVIPTYNHQRQVTLVLTDVSRLQFPVIVVDDGSTDDTWRTIEDWRRTNPDTNMVAIRHEANRGKAAALHTGFAAARTLARVTHAVTIDSDGQLDAADIPALLEAARNCPRALVLGFRPLTMPGCPPRCEVGRRFASLALFAETGRRLLDTQCGLRVYPLDLLSHVQCTAGRYAFEAEVIARASWAGFPILEVPVHCRYHLGSERVSHFRPVVDSLRQTGVHVRLLLRVLLPWTTPTRVRSRKGFRNTLLDFARWLNPLRCLRDLRGSELGQMEFASALALGAWIGTSPFFGLHTAICLYVAWRLNLRPAAMILGSQVSLPPLGVALAMLSAWVGHVLLTGRILVLNEFKLEWSEIPRLAWQWLPAWLLGSCVVGLVLALAVFGATLLATMPLRRSLPSPT
jgi:uncharacterized protein (DUF2062 family)